VIHFGEKIWLILVFLPVKPIRLIILMARQPPVGQSLVIVEASRSHSDTPHSVGLLWMSDLPTQSCAAIGTRTPEPLFLSSNRPK